MSYSRALMLRILTIALLLQAGSASAVSGAPEYELKAALLYNFALFTDWPSDTGPVLNICVSGADPFGATLDTLTGKLVQQRRIAVSRLAPHEPPTRCQVVFIANSAIPALERVLIDLEGRPTLTVADTAGAAQRGAMLNMRMSGDRITFEANARAARQAGLGLNARLLRLATEVIK